MLLAIARNLQKYFRSEGSPEETASPLLDNPTDPPSSLCFSMAPGRGNRGKLQQVIISAVIITLFCCQSISCCHLEASGGGNRGDDDNVLASHTPHPHISSSSGKADPQNAMLSTSSSAEGHFAVK